MKVGIKVKIDDIGPLATCIQAGKHMVRVELEGEQFWIMTDLLQIADMEVEP